MSNRDIKIAKNEVKETKKRQEMIGEYATVEEAIDAKETELKKTIPELDLSILLQRIRR